MNQVFDLSKNIICNVLEKGTPFALAIKNTFKKYNVDKDDAKNISALVGCELRHHLLFAQLSKDYFGDVPFSATIGVAFLLCNAMFLKRFDEEELIKFAKETLYKLDPNADINPIDELLKIAKTTGEIIPNRFAKDSIEYLSFRFNTPLWIIRMWTKQFGRGICYKMLKANYRPSATTVGVNHLFGSEKEVLEQNPFFEKTKNDDLLIYNGKVPLKKTQAFINNQVFYERQATKEIINKLEIEPIKKLAIYCAFQNNIFLELSSRFGINLEMDIINSNTQSYFETKKVIESIGLNRIRLYDESYKSIYTCISNPVDLMFVLPRNSMLDLLRSTPDYFLKIKQDDLDGLIAEQKETLDNADKVVEKGGRIIYMLPSLSMKEGHLLIKEFLSAHPSYTLIEEKQFLPFEDGDSCLYFANLKKEN